MTSQKKRKKRRFNIDKDKNKRIREKQRKYLGDGWEDDAYDEVYVA